MGVKKKAGRRDILLMCWMWMLWMSVSPTVAGQESDPQLGEATDAGMRDRIAEPSAAVSPTPATGEALRPPELLELPLIEKLVDGSPSIATRPYGTIEAIVLVDSEGAARLELCEADMDDCMLAEEAIAAARFIPASVGGRPHAARIRVSFPVHYIDPASAPSSLDSADASVEADALGAAETKAEPGMPLEAPQDYGARAAVATLEATAQPFGAEQIRDVPSAMGDPFRALDTLPGIAPVVSGLPYLLVRGASPAGTRYVYDGIDVPLLFHLGAGPAVIHPAMLGDLNFFPSVPPIRYGRLTGGLVEATGVTAGAKDNRGELELRLLDAQAFIHAPVGEGHVTLAGRYGYPGLIASALSSDLTLSYWDYQSRLTYPLSEHIETELVLLGARDKAMTAGQEAMGLSLQFHRLEPRVHYRRGAFSLSTALQAGYDHAQLGAPLSATTFRLGARLWSTLHLSDHVKWRWGADVTQARGRLTGMDSAPQDEGVAGSSDEQSATRGRPMDGNLLAGETWAEFGQEGRQSTTVIGAHSALELTLGRLSIVPALRIDTWSGAVISELGIDPRVSAHYALAPGWRLHAATGFVHQLASPPIPLPGIGDLAVQPGLQRNLQSEMGARWELEWGIELDATAFYSRLSDVVLIEPLLQCTGSASSTVFCPEGERTTMQPRGRVDAYGLELLARRSPTHALSGWASYTLARADGRVLGKVFDPRYDIRHTFNGVLQWQPSTWSFGLRLLARSGQMGEAVLVDGNRLDPDQVIRRRLPGFYRLDFSAAKVWSHDWGTLELRFEWVNLTLRQEPRALECARTVAGEPQCDTVYEGLLVLPNLGLRARF